MKKDGSKVLLTFGIIIIILSIIISTGFFYSLVKNSVLSWSLFIVYIILSPVLNPLGVTGLILVVIALKKIKKTHRKKKQERLPDWLKGSLFGSLVGSVLFFMKVYNISFCEIKAKVNVMCLVLKLSDLVSHHQIPILRIILVAFGRTAFVLLTPIFFVLEFILIGALITLISEKVGKFVKRAI